MDDFLTAISTTSVKHTKELEPIIEPTPAKQDGRIERGNLDSPEEIPNILKAQPNLDVVNNILNYLTTESRKKDGFNLVTPGPVQAQIVDALVKIIIPDYWRTLKEFSRQRKLLVESLQNVNGLGAILSRLRPLIVDLRQTKAVGSTRDTSGHIEDLLGVLEQILSDDEFSSNVWTSIRANAQNPIQKALMWKEYVSQIASGRLLSLVAEAEDVLKGRGSSRKACWCGNGNEYASWIGRNVAVLMRRNVDIEDSMAAVTELCGKLLSLGYLDRIAAALVMSTIADNSTKILETFLPKLKPHEQRKYFNAIITILTNELLSSAMETREDLSLQASSTVSGAATLIHSIIKDNELLRDQTVTILTQPTLPTLDDSLQARRSLIAAVAQDDEKLQTVLEKSLKLFGDSFYIRHTPILQQEALAQTLAITCSYIQRTQPMFLIMMAKSSYHVSGMSNRIGATSPRARFLGMAVGSAISKMVDKSELQLTFDLEGDEATEAEWYQRLTCVDDKFGQLKSLGIKKKGKELASNTLGRNEKPTKQSHQEQKSSKKLVVPEIKGPRIVEIVDESSDEESDFIAYEKPDSDPEDDADDPTEINRNKARAPVYIRDLIIGLRDQEDFDRHQLALTTAASLIRRKASFGTEVVDHLEELASILTGLSDNFDLTEFNGQRQQALVAVLIAKPGPMAQWFARAFFSGDYSLQQRIAILTTLGLGARELAGLKDSSTDDLKPATASFPSKQLPPHLHRIYAEDTNPVAKITGNLARQILSPIAADAAEKLSGPDILKVRKFSSRMEVEQRRSKPIPNALAQIVANNFFFPLTGRWWITTRSSSSSDNLYTSAHLLPPYLHTLALLLNASGANTLALSQMTRELWELLLSVRTIAANDKEVLRALLFAFLMLLETNENKERLATDQAKELLETQQWVQLVFNSLGAGSEEDERVRVLAAGVIVRCQEVVEKYQRRMAGSMMDY